MRPHDACFDGRSPRFSGQWWEAALRLLALSALVVALIVDPSVAGRGERPGRGTIEQPAEQTDSIPGRPIPAIDPRTGSPSSIRANHFFASGAIDETWAPDSALGATLSGGSLVRSCSDGVAGRYIAWVDERDGQANIRVLRIASDTLADATWPLDGVVVCRAPGSRYQADIARDGAGGAYIVWKDFRGDGDIYAQRLSANGTLAPGWSEEGVPVCVAEGDQSNPRISLTSGGGALVVWEDRRTGLSTVFAQHLGDQGEPVGGWPVGGVQISSASNPAASPQVFSNSLGQVVATWQRRTGPEVVDLVLARLGDDLASGEVLPAASMLASGADQFGEVGGVCDQAGMLTLAWSERRAGAASLRAQRLPTNGAGEPMWPAGGVVVRDGETGRTAPALALPSDSTVALAWQGSSTEAESDVFVQMLQSKGDVAVGWPGGGLAACVARGDQYAPAVRSDGQGGVIVDWIDARPAGGAAAATAVTRTTAAAQLVSAVATPGRARVVWQLALGGPQSAIVERRIEQGAWGAIPAPFLSDSARVVVDDREVTDGAQVEYRLRLKSRGVEAYLAPVSLVIPVAPRTLTLHRVRVLGREHALQVSFALPRGNSPRLDLLDIQGRRAAEFRIDGLDPGEQQFRWVLPSQLASGVYFLRLLQGREERVAKVIYVR